MVLVDAGAGASAPCHRLVSCIPYTLLQAGLDAEAQLIVPEPDNHEPQLDTTSLYQTHMHVMEVMLMA